MSNLTVACEDCNQSKNNLTAAEFGHPNIQKQALRPLKDAAAVNATRYAIGAALKTLGLPISFWSGGRTKFNRTQQCYPKAHWIDAACVGESGEHVRLDSSMQVRQVKLRRTINNGTAPMLRCLRTILSCPALVIGLPLSIPRLLSYCQISRRVYFFIDTIIDIHLQQLAVMMIISGN